MKNEYPRIIFKCLFVFMFINSIFFISGASGKAPSIYVSQDYYEFPTVPAGKPVVHDFIIQNTGDEPLTIENVESDCGCTAVVFSKQIPPNGKGKVSVELNTIDYGGNFIQKYLEIFSNDPKTPVLSLTIRGTVDKFVDIDPLTAYLKGRSGTDIKTQVTITPTAKYPFRIIEIKAQNGKDISCSITKKNFSTGSAAYIFNIENLKKSPGRYFDIVHLKTDSQIQSVLKVFVSGDIGE